jgi:hypothetical protein
VRLSTSHANDANTCPAPNPIAPTRCPPKIPTPQSINPRSRPKAPGEISRPKLPVELMTTAQEAHDLDAEALRVLPTIALEFPDQRESKKKRGPTQCPPSLGTFEAIAHFDQFGALCQWGRTTALECPNDSMADLAPSGLRFPDITESDSLLFSRSRG